MYALFHGGDLSSNQMVGLFLFWGGVLTAFVCFIVVIVKRLRKE